MWLLPFHCHAGLVRVQITGPGGDVPWAAADSVEVIFDNGGTNTYLSMVIGPLDFSGNIVGKTDQELLLLPVLAVPTSSYNVVWSFYHSGSYCGAVELATATYIPGSGSPSYDMRADAVLTVLWDCNNQSNPVSFMYVPPTYHGLFWVDYSQPTYWFFVGWGMVWSFYGLAWVLRIVRRIGGTAYHAEL